MYLKADDYEHPIKLTISNTELEPAKVFFKGEHVAVTGMVSLQNGCPEIIVNKVSQIKPILWDNVIMPGFN